MPLQNGRNVLNSSIPKMPLQNGRNILNSSNPILPLQNGRSAQDQCLSYTIQNWACFN